MTGGILPKIVVILGPTACGKTDLAINLAKKFNGEVISADSRQIFKKMSIGTAKPEGEWRELGGEKVYLVAGVPHHVMDIVDPGREFSLSDYKKAAGQAIARVLSRGRLPIVAGGTGLYIWALVDNLDMPRVAPNKRLRRELEAKALPELVGLLRQLDSETAEKIDLKNPRRVVRALEVAIMSGESFAQQKKLAAPLYQTLQIGLVCPREELYDRIEHRIDGQLAAGMVKEVQALKKQKYSWSLSSLTSFGYKQLGAYLRGELGLAEAVEEFKRDTRRYAKRQLTWFKRDKRIKWIERNDVRTAEKLVREFLQKS